MRPPVVIAAKPSVADWAMLLALGLIWGGAFMMTRIAVEAFQPLTLAGLRLSLGALVLWALLTLRGERLPGPGAPGAAAFWGWAAAVAILSNAAPFTLLAWSQRHVDSALAGVFMALVPLFILPLGHWLIPGERMTGRRIAGFALGFLGLLILIGPEALAGLGRGEAVALLAQGGLVLVTVCYATGSIVSKRAPDLGLVRFATAALLLAALMTAPLALVLERPFAALPAIGPLAAVVYLGVVPTALATVMLLAVIRSAGPSFLSLVNYQVPLWAVVFGTLVLGEEPSPRLGLALALILGGLGVSQGVLGIRRGGHARG